MVATLSVKNLVMAAPLHSTRKETAAWHDKSKYHQGYREIQMNLAITARRMRPFWGATVIDGFEGMEGEGPLKGTPVASRIAIASTDFVAADRIGVEAMGVDPTWVGYLGYCCDAGLGQYDCLDDRPARRRARRRGAEGIQTPPADFAATGMDGPAAEGMIARGVSGDIILA